VWQDIQQSWLYIPRGVGRVLDTVGLESLLFIEIDLGIRFELLAFQATRLNSYNHQKPIVIRVMDHVVASSDRCVIEARHDNGSDHTTGCWWLVLNNIRRKNNWPLSRIAAGASDMLSIVVLYRRAVGDEGGEDFDGSYEETGGSDGMVWVVWCGVVW
jgi:hypothetical protein